MDMLIKMISKEEDAKEEEEVGSSESSSEEEESSSEDLGDQVGVVCVVPKDNCYDVFFILVL